MGGQLKGIKPKLDNLPISLHLEWHQLTAIRTEEHKIVCPIAQDGRHGSVRSGRGRWTQRQGRSIVVQCHNEPVLGTGCRA
jgi:hypothetical protein